MKRCSRCKQIKPITEFYKDKYSFDGLQYRCKGCSKKDSKIWYNSNKEWDNKQSKKWLKKHPGYHSNYYFDNIDQEKLRGKTWHEENPGYRNAYSNKRRAEDPYFRMIGNLRGDMNHILRGRVKAGHTVEDMGCSPEQLKRNLLKLLPSDLKYEDYGKTWEIDHKIPLAYFDITSRAQFLKAVNYKNLQPLRISENRRKNSFYKGKKYKHSDKVRGG